MLGTPPGKRIVYLVFAAGRAARWLGAVRIVFAGPMVGGRAVAEVPVDRERMAATGGSPSRAMPRFVRAAVVVLAALFPLYPARAAPTTLESYVQAFPLTPSDIVRIKAAIAAQAPLLPLAVEVARVSSPVGGDEWVGRKQASTTRHHGGGPIVATVV